MEPVFIGSTYRDFQRGFEEREPRLWSIVYPRTYVDIGGWESPKIAATAFAVVISILAKVGDPTLLPRSNLDGFLVASRCRDYGFPTFFVKRELLAALQQTQLPEKLSWKDVPLPYPGMTFVFPTGAIRHPTDGPIGFVAIGSVPAGYIAAFPEIETKAYEVTNHSIGMFTAAHNKAGVPLLSSVWDPETCVPSEKAPMAGECVMFNEKGEIEVMALSADDTTFLTRMGQFVVALILVMHARTDILSEGKATAKQTKSTGTPFWTPHILGDNYRIHRETSGSGSHTSPRVHFRRGHLRRQHYGTEGTLVKTIWIEPTVVYPQKTD